MNLKQLSLEIQKSPQDYHYLIDNFKTDSKELRDFLDSLKSTVVYVVPSLIEHFNNSYQNKSTKTLKDLMVDRENIGTQFVLSKDDTNWTYLGVSVNAKPMCRPVNSDITIELDDQDEIKWIF